MAIELAKAYLPIIPSLGKGFRGNLERELFAVTGPMGSDAGKKLGQEIGSTTANALGKELIAAGQKTGNDFRSSLMGSFKVLGGDLREIISRDLDLDAPFKAAAKKLEPTITKVSEAMKKPGLNFIAGLQSAQAAESSFTGKLGTLGGKMNILGDTMRRPGDNFMLGLRNAEAAQSTFTGRLGTLGGKVTILGDTMRRPGDNFMLGLRSAEAAESTFTGRMGTLGGKVNLLGETMRTPGRAFSEGLRGTSAEESAFTGRISGISRRTGSLAGLMLRPGQNFINGLKSTEAAQSSFTGRMGTIGGQVASLGSAFTSFGSNIKGAFSGAFDPAKVEATQASDHISREMGEAGNKSGGAFKNSFKGAIAGLGVYVGATEILGGVKTAINNAGNLEQSVGAVDSVFKDSAGQMQAWSFQAAQSVGLSKNAYNELASKLGASLKNAGTPMDELGGKTNGLITMGADLASMFGGTTAEAIDAIGSALRGEMDPIEKYGISLNDAALTAKGLELGIEKTGGAFTTQQKQLITQALLFEQSADAQGNFAKESDTFQGKLQRAGAQWENVSTKMGELFLPVLSNVLGFIGGTALPAIDAFVGGIRAFGGAWEANDGILTSSGFAGFMEQAAFAIRGVYDWVTSTLPIWGPFAAGIGIVAGTFAVWSGATWALTAAAGALSGVIAFLTSPITLVIAAIGLLVGGLILAYNHVGWFRDLVQLAWGQIQLAIGFVVDWWTTTAWPAIQTGLQVLGQWFTWLWQSVIVPAWNAIAAVIQAAWVNYIQPALMAVWNFIQGTLAPIFMWLWQSIIVPVFNAIVAVLTWAWNTIIIPLLGFVVAFVKNVLAPIFMWLWQNIITPVWNGIVLVIQVAWKIIEVVFGLINGFLRGVLGPAFEWLWANVISPVWGWISDKISRVGDFLTGTVFPKLGDGLEWLQKVFERVKDGIGTAWDALKDLVKVPVRFVINTVINDGMIAGYNKLNDFWDGKDISKIQLGFRKGGYTGNLGKNKIAGVVHGQEHVTRAESTARVNREHPGFFETLNRTGSVAQALGAASGGHRHGVGAHCAHCAASGAAVGHSTTASTAGAPPSGPSGIWGGFQAQISRAGRLYVPKMNFMGVDTENVARAWMGRSAVEIIAGNGTPSVSFATGGAGTYGFNAGSQIWMQNAVPGNLREAVLIHELGHALSLHHTMNTGSIMHPLQAGPTWPSGLDYGSLSRAWGKPGEGVTTYEGGNSGPSWLGKVAEWLSQPVKKLLDGARQRANGNGFYEMPIGIAGKALDSLVDSIGRIGSSKASMGVKPALYDNGGIINRGLQIIDHQRSTPDYVLTDTQWDAMIRLAQVAETQQASSGITIGAVHGYTADEVAEAIEKQRQRHEALYAMV